MAPLLESQNVAFVFDGLDEVPTHLKQRLLEIVLLARKRWQHCYFLLTTRKSDAALLGNTEFSQFSVVGTLSWPEAERLMQRWALALGQDQRNYESLLDKVRTILFQSPNSSSLLNTPLSVALLSLTFWRSSSAPTNKASLYASVTNWLFDSRTAQRIAGSVDIATTKRILEATAFFLLGNANQKTGAAATVDVLVENVSAILSITKESIEKALRFEIAIGSCIEEIQGQISFFTR